MRFIENDATVKAASDLPSKVEELEYGDAADWKKVSGTVYAEFHHYIVHWYENNGKVPEYEIKLKGAK